MAFTATRYFSAYSAAQKNLEEEKRPDSPTIMVTKSNIKKQLLLESTLFLINIYQECNPNFFFDPEENPSRPLTKPSEPMHNDGFDNEDFNYILYINKKLVSPEGEKYTILDSLGEGTFGQVVKCKTTKGALCAAKIIKNKPAYYIQGLIEVKILSKLNKELDCNDSSNIVRMIDYFVFRNHLVIIFQLLSFNLYELIRKNGMRGFSLSLIRSFTKQMLEALCVLEQGNIIHCDMKPENVLLVNDRAHIKVIDFGSACFENATIYTYIQSRYYRSPEVLVGLPYGSEIDSWSLGCICAELFIGIPLFPGCNEYDQLYRIEQLLGPLPQHMIIEGKFRDKLFIEDSGYFRLKTREEFMQVCFIQTQSITLPAFRTYVDISKLEDLLVLDRRIPEDIDIESRRPFIDFLKGLLNIDPATRWTASQAILHPFIKGGSIQEFSPASSETYLEIQKRRSAPVGALRGSCPSLLQRIRGSQDMTVKPKDICFRPLVEELTDDVFTGFAHGKLVQVQQPPLQSFTQWMNPFINMPIDIQPNSYMKSNHERPMPNIIGPRYTRPHSYQDHHQLSRPSSPMIEKNISKNKKFNSGKFKKRVDKNKKHRSDGSKYVEYLPKVMSEQPRPSSNDEKKAVPTEKIYTFHIKDAIAITNLNYNGSKAVDPSGYLSKVKKEATQHEVIKSE